MSELENKSVVITGASRGIGEAAAREFAALGAKVLLCARSEGDIARIAEDIRSKGGTALHQAMDVAKYDEVESALDRANSAFGGIDVLINNAGVIDPVEHLAEATVDAWNTVIDINVKGVFHGIRAALPIMKKNGAGHILTIGSGAGTSALEGWSHYCASKAAVHHLNRVLHREEGENGIRAIVLSPGTVATDMQKVIRESGVNPVSQINWDDHIPADWPAKALVWMTSEDSNDHLGEVVSLRDEGIRKRVGLI